MLSGIQTFMRKILSNVPDKHVVIVFDFNKNTKLVNVIGCVIL